MTKYEKLNSQVEAEIAANRARATSSLAARLDDPRLSAEEIRATRELVERVRPGSSTEQTQKDGEKE